MKFLAIDFETAHFSSDSACAIGVVRVENNQIIAHNHYLIRPPSPIFNFTHIHGISWDMVKEAPHFGEIWPLIAASFDGIDFVVAHNVSFDRKVLHACCARYGITLPDLRYECTVHLARKHMGIFPTNLPEVCRRLKIELDHHNALSDALACAKIAIAAFAQVNSRLSAI